MVSVSWMWVLCALVVTDGVRAIAMLRMRFTE